jgi:DDE family transposase/transposase-like protein DUF772
MLGKRRAQRDRLDVGNVFRLELDPHSFHGQLAAAAARLFKDADFATFYADRTGRPSVPPSQLARLTLRQHHDGCSDAEAVARSADDRRWAAVLGRPAGQPLCAQSTFPLFRAPLVLHDAVLTLFQRRIQAAQAAGRLKHGPLKVALDTQPILGRGAVLDTYNLLGQGILQLLRALAKEQHQTPQAWAATRAFSRYFHPSLKGSADLDWSDKEARNQFLAEIVTDARRLLRLAGEALDGEGAAAIREGAQLLEQLLLQDVVETPGDAGGPQASLRQGTAPGRIPSVTDPEQRPGRKSSSQRFNGHKGALATDRDSQMIVDVDGLEGSAADAVGAVEQGERVEANSGQQGAQTQGDGAYGGAGTRQAFTAAGRELGAKVPQEASNGGRFPKRAFELNVLEERGTGPAGQTTGEFTLEPEGGKGFRFGAVCGWCPLREPCTEAKEGRTLRMQPLEAELRAAREDQQSEAGRSALRQRVVGEQRLARLGQLGMGQARYVGRAKTRCQLRLLSTIANLRRVWNWVEAQPGSGNGTGREGQGEVASRAGRAPQKEAYALGNPRQGGWRALLRLLQLLHRPILRRAIGHSAAGFRPRF